LLSNYVAVEAAAAAVAMGIYLQSSRLGETSAWCETFNPSYAEDMTGDFHTSNCFFFFFKNPTPFFQYCKKNTKNEKWIFLPLWDGHKRVAIRLSTAREHIFSPLHTWYVQGAEGGGRSDLKIGTLAIPQFFWKLCTKMDFPP
jgi:hypothetical protein